MAKAEARLPDGQASEAWEQEEQKEEEEKPAEAWEKTVGPLGVRNP